MRSGFYMRRRGILEHLERGTISLLDSAVHDFLCLIADHRTGVAWASAEKIMALCPTGTSLKSIQRSLAKLDDLKWIKRFRVEGRRGNYPIVIGRYFVRDASRRWMAVNLESTSDYSDVKFDPVTDPSLAANSTVTDAGMEVGTEAGSELSPEVEVRSETLDVGRKKRDMSPENGDVPPQTSGALPVASSQPEPEHFEMLRRLGPRELKARKTSLERSLGDRRFPDAMREIYRKELNEVMTLLRETGDGGPKPVLVGERRKAG